MKREQEKNKDPVVSRHFITYGDSRFASAKGRIIREAQATGEFDRVVSYGPEDVSEDLRREPIFAERRGGGYWTWKPDIIFTEMKDMQDDDILVYADAGCELVPGREWGRYWRILKTKELVAQRIYQTNVQWTRQTIVKTFSENPCGWLRCCQFMATVVMLRKTQMTIRLVDEWRSLMVSRPELVRDVMPDERAGESPEFIENRHDQALLSALLYRELGRGDSRRRIHVQWEHVENLDILRSHVIRAMRWNMDCPIPLHRRFREAFIRLGKDAILRPIYQIFAH